jgi:CubicO group peptidase (beta-lactamase class C family)
MKIRLSRTVVAGVVAFLLALMALVSTTLPAVAATRSNEADFAQIDAYVSSQMQAMRLPGLALGIVHGNQIVHLHGFGEADQSGRAVTAQTPFVIGSMTKSFTALAIMQLVEAGKIQLDAPVQHGA